MCLALPAEIVEVGPDGETAIVSLDGIRKEISLVLVDGVGPGDFVLVHVGYALSAVSQSEARETLALMAAVDVSGGAEPGDAL